MKTSRGAFLSAVALATLPLVQACTSREVVGVEIGTVTTHPSTANLVDGQRLQFTATVTDRDGELLQGASVTWTTDDPDIVSVDSAGVVEALRAGEATIRAAFQGVEGTATVTVLPPGSIVLSPDSASFQGSEGGPAPTPIVIQVLSSGAGTVGALEASVDYAPGQPAGWLTTRLGATEAPTSLTLTAQTSGLPGATYLATVVLHSDAEHGPVSIPVSLLLAGTRIRVTESDGSTIVGESGGADDFTVVLESEPPSDVVVELASGDPTEVTLSTTRLTFTPSSWSVEQTVRVTAPDDPTLDGDQETLVELRVVRTQSGSASGQGPDEVVRVTTIDDEVAGFTVTESGGNTVVFGGGSDELAVALDAQPLSDVVIDISSADPSRVTVLPERLIFTSESWDSPQVVTVRGGPSGSFSLQRIDVTLRVNRELSNDGFDSVPDHVVVVRRIG